MAKSQKKVEREIEKATRRAMTSGEGAVAVANVARKLNDGEGEPLTPEKTGRLPGTVIGDTKVIYTEADLNRMFPKVTFTPEVTMPISYQGVRYQLISNWEMTVPEPIKKIYDKHRQPNRQRDGQLHSEGIIVEKGAGKL